LNLPPRHGLNRALRTPVDDCSVKVVALSRYHQYSAVDYDLCASRVVGEQVRDIAARGHSLRSIWSAGPGGVTSAAARFTACNTRSARRLKAPSEHHGSPAAKAFFRSSKAVTGLTPARVTTDGHDAYPRAIRTELDRHMRQRKSCYLDNRIEEDHRYIKRRSRPMLGLNRTALAMRYCRCHDELRDVLCYSNMLPLRHGEGSTCGKQRLPSRS